MCWRDWRWRGALRELDGVVPEEATGVKVHERCGTPCVAGVWRPVVVMPVDLPATLSRRQWMWVLRHEREHIRGHDTRVALVLAVLRVGFWWNPFVHALAAQWGQAREEVCDAVARGDDDAGGYAGLLLDMAARPCGGSGRVLAMAASRPARRLRARLEAVLDGKPVRRRVGLGYVMGMMVSGLVAAVLVSGLGIGGSVKAADAEKSVAVGASDDGRLYDRTFLIAPNLPMVLDGESELPMVKRLEDLGVAFPEGASATHVSTTSQLVVRNTKANLDKLGVVLERLKKLKEVRELQFYVTSKFVEMPVETRLKLPMELGDTVFSDAQFQLVVRELAQRKGVDLLSAPSVTMRAGQEALVEVVKELPTDGGETGMDFVGTRVSASVDFERGQIKVKLTATLGILAGKTMAETLKAGIGDEIRKADRKLEYLKNSDLFLLPNNHTKLLNLGETIPGRKVLLFVTVRLIEPNGQPLNDQEMKRWLEGAAAGDDDVGKGVPAPPKRVLSGADRSKPVRVRLQLIEKPYDPAEPFNGALFEATAVEKKAEEEKEKSTEDLFTPLGSLSPVPPEFYSLSGVFSAKHKEKLMNHLAGLEGVTVHAERVFETTDGKMVRELVAEKMKDFWCEVEPVIGPEGYTVDLNIGVPEKGRKVTTAVTVWNGQTVGLSDMPNPDAADKRHRLVLVTVDF
jgi:hypothetical protein